MNNKPTFNQIAWVLSDFIADDSHKLLRATESIEYLINTYWPTKSVIAPTDSEAVWDGSNWKFPHDVLVRKALDSSAVMMEVAYTRKIQAIKELRNITKCGLREAKDAIEDPRVWNDKNTNNYGEDQL